MTARGGDDQSMGSSIGMVIAPTYVNDNGGQAASAWSNVFPHAKNIARFGFNEGHYFKPGTTSANIANVDPAYITRSLEAREETNRGSAPVGGLLPALCGFNDRQR